MMKLIKILLLVVFLAIVGYFVFKDKVDPYLPHELRNFLNKAQESVINLTSKKVGAPSTN